MRCYVLLGAAVFLMVSVTGHAAGKAARGGKEIFHKVCLACHDSGMMDAPIAFSPEFKARLAAKGLEGLLDSASSGIGDMPVRGSCADCSDEELRAAIKYMLELE